MPKNADSLNRSLFDLLRSRGYDPIMLDTSGKEIPIPEEAEVFQFNFVKDGENYGKVTLSIDGLHKLVVYFSDDVANSEKEESDSGDNSWYTLLRYLKKYATKRQLSFELKNADHLKHDMAKRDHMKKQETISEGYYSMGKKASYSDAIPTVKMVIQHSRQIEEGEQRYRNVARIFLENQDGERFLAPTTKPGIAKVYARHIAEGGKPHDDRWNHIGSLCEEYQKMAGFVRATRNGQFNESAQQLVNEGVAHYNKLRESLGKMTGHRGYNIYFESWTPPLMEDDSDTTSINELFVQETLDPRIESVMPILSKLHKQVREMSEVSALAEWAESLVEGPGPAVTAQQNSDSPAMRGSPALAHYAAKLDAELEEDDGGQGALNPVGIPEGMLDNPGEEVSPVAQAITRRILMQRVDLLSKFGPESVSAAIDSIADFVGDTDEIGSSDVSGWVKQVERELSGSQGVTEGASSGIEGILAQHPEAVENFRHGGDMDYDLESDLWDYYFNKGDIRNYDADASEFIGQQLADYLGVTEEVSEEIRNTDDPYDGMVEDYLDYLESVGQLDKSREEEKASLIADLESGVTHSSEIEYALSGTKWDPLAEDLGPDQKRVGQLGPTEKVKNNNIGKLVGANENFINTDAQAVVTEEDDIEQVDEGANELASLLKLLGK